MFVYLVLSFCLSFMVFAIIDNLYFYYKARVHRNLNFAEKSAFAIIIIVYIFAIIYGITLIDTMQAIKGVSMK